MTDLYAALNRFRQQANGNAAVRRIAGGWSQTLVVESRDTGTAYQVDIGGGQMSEVRARDAGQEEQGLLIRGDEAVLCRIFSGVLNPVKAYNDGALEIYGEQRDQVKLDAISLVLWGA